MEIFHEKLLERIRSLSEKECEAMTWLINHYSDLVNICKTKALTEEERIAAIAEAQEQEDMHMLALLLLERRVNTDWTDDLTQPPCQSSGKQI